MMMKKKKRLWMVMIVLAAAVGSAEAGRKDWKIGVQCWSFRHKTLMETVNYCARQGIRHLEIYPGQRIGGDFMGVTSHAMSEEDADKLRAVLDERGFRLLSYGVVRAGNEDQWRPVFEFAQRMGIATIITEPNRGQMEMLDKLTAEYGVKIGIHNHGEPTPEMVEKLLEGCSNRIGIAPDNGHWSRRGIDNLAALKQFEGRMVSIHLKDINESKRDVPFGAGTTPVGDILAYLDKADYKGPIIIEYESGNQEEDVARCIRYLKIFVDTGTAPESAVAAQAPDEFVAMADINAVLGGYNALAPVGWSTASGAIREALEGTVTGSAAGAAGAAEGPEKAFDGNAATKYCVLEPTMWVQIELAGGKRRVQGYAITTANDAPGRDPKDWLLKGSNDGEHWTVLDRQSGQSFDGRLARRKFELAEPAEYTTYRLEITQNHGMDSSQIAEIELR